MIESIFENEMNIIEYLQMHLNNSETFLFHGNSLEHKIFHCLQDRENLIPHNKNTDAPPDFLSPEYNIMFDVMRVNDTEIKKHYNPVKQRERKALQELNQTKMFNKSDENIKACISSETSNPDEHLFSNYKKNLQRVTKDHLTSKGHKNKIDEIWVSQNPNIKYKGFLIFDETECCFDGKIVHVRGSNFGFIPNVPLVIHEPWNDKDFIQWAYDSEIDFVVWACCYKPSGTLPRKLNITFPYIVIIDVRYPRTEKYIDYSNNHLVL